MSKVTRYDLNEDVATGVVDITPVPENLQGRFVSYEDYAKLEDRLARSDDYCVGVDTERMEYFDKCNALAAENAALKDFALSLYFQDGTSQVQGQDLPLTPATDAYLNSVRAEGVDDLATFAGEQYHQHAGDKAQQKKWKSLVFLCTQFAAKLRAGEPS